LVLTIFFVLVTLIILIFVFLIFFLFFVFLLFFLVLILIFVLIFVLLLLGTFFRYDKVITGFFICWIISQSIFIGFDSFFALFILHQDITYIVECLMFVIFIGSIFSCLLLTEQRFFIITVFVVGITKIVSTCNIVWLL